MLKFYSQRFGRLARIVLISVLVIGLSLFSNPNGASASSKVATPEALDMAISEAAQEFVESVLDEYADMLEGAFDTAYDPLKSSVKGVTKQLTKAEKAAMKGGGTATPALVIPQEPFQAAIDSFATLQETTAGFKAQLESSSEVVQALISEQIGAKMTALEEAIATAATTVDEIATDVSTLDPADPATTTAFSEHATALTQSIQAVDLAIGAFDS